MLKRDWLNNQWKGCMHWSLDDLHFIHTPYAGLNVGDCQNFYKILPHFFIRQRGGL